jgi:hypothetical protein
MFVFAAGFHNFFRRSNVTILRALRVLRGKNDGDSTTKTTKDTMDSDRVVTKIRDNPHQSVGSFKFSGGMGNVITR